MNDHIAVWKAKEFLKRYGLYNEMYAEDGMFKLDVIPTLTWKVLPWFGVRREVLKLFSDPKIVIATSNMNEVALGDKVEAFVGNVSSNSQELTIQGGSVFQIGDSGVLIDLPEAASRVYTSIKFANNGVSFGSLFGFMQSTGVLARESGAYGYLVCLSVVQAADDFTLHKTLNGSFSVLGEEYVDLTADTFYLVEMYSDIDRVKVWRDNVLKFDVNGDTTNITEFNEIQFYTDDNSIAAACVTRVRGEVVVIYE